jgi:hypothetical protein
MRLFSIILVGSLAVFAQGQDYSADLLQAAMNGRTGKVKAFLDNGASLEAVDADGRTPLMLAAQHGQLATVELLLGRGANASARDRQGDSAYTLAMFDPVGRGSHEEVLKLLPKPPRPKLAIEVTWSASRLTSSCFGTREEVTRTLDQIHLDDKFLRAFADYARISGRNLVELVGRPADADGLLRVQLAPSSACSAPDGDNLNLTVDVNVLGEPGGTFAFAKSYGGAVKGPSAKQAASLAQYAALFEPSIAPHVGPIYWAAVAAVYRLAPAR